MLLPFIGRLVQPSDAQDRHLTFAWWQGRFKQHVPGESKPAPRQLWVLQQGFGYVDNSPVGPVTLRHLAIVIGKRRKIAEGDSLFSRDHVLLHLSTDIGSGLSTDSYPPVAHLARTVKSNLANARRQPPPTPSLLSSPGQGQGEKIDEGSQLSQGSSSSFPVERR